MEGKATKVKISDLVIDPKLIELRPINLFYVDRYRKAMRVGSVFPSIIIEEGTNRVISGNHRVSAYLDEYGGDHVVAAIAETFPDEATVIRRFAEENTRHGMPLSNISRKAIVHALFKLGDSPENIAAILDIPVRQVKNLGDMVVLVVGKGKKGEMKPIKYGLGHMAGQKITPKQYEEHRKADRGVPIGMLARQIQRWIDNGWVDMTDMTTLSVLTDLYESLGKLMEGQLQDVK